MIAHPRPRLLAAGALSLVAVLALSACSGSTVEPDASATPVDGGTLVYASGDAEPDCLDPHVGGNYPQALLATQVLEQLVSRDAEGTIVPWLAEGWELAEDGLSMDVTLKPGVSFTDGTPLDAEAVARNIAHLQDPDTGSSTGYLALERVERVEAVSDTVARFVLSEPDSALLESLAQPWLAIQSPAGLDRGTDENCLAPIGTGPFIIDDWVKQDHISLVRNDDYASAPADADHDGPAHLEGIIWRFLPDATTRYAALEAGDVDVIDNAQPDAVARAESDGGISDIDAPRPGSVNRLELNSGQAPFDDERVRQAFLAAVDVNPGIESLFAGTAARSYSPLSSAETAAYSDEAPFAVDVERAAELLDEAGWDEVGSDGVRSRDGQRLTLRLPVSTNQSIPAEVSLFEQIQAQAAEVGFEVTIDQLDLSSWYAALGANEYELVSAPYTKLGPDVLRILYHSDGIVPAPSGYFANHAQIDDPELDDVLDRASRSQDADERSELYTAAQRTILEGSYILPLYDQQNHFLVSDDVAGVRATDTVSTVWLGDAWLVG
ncbi:ABC transporter substrate-binding protein [Mycetocola reblochoni]|uniref:Oligopeptide ABC transporter, periplasmic oligopeptide-binding protein OppA (TC 3.A.1.5.1) n=2 Tax=Mycetocola reblochoni TaxID=331618 RepID=A0A1R4JDT4_9MICO|nr:ABC transporter substrate-binding protein [Mycetocola reblochoni]RLP69931.1 ABC transporter substrate-binding protein [Mycetocola reblochoni]SJN30104.1 Oligopeptide ABC transporter, periplasmic oligopeptide-binding protein OppA (TC 3.A.1.5.1) [Mycetocola reblochoni REB411]